MQIGATGAPSTKGGGQRAATAFAALHTFQRGRRGKALPLPVGASASHSSCRSLFEDKVAQSVQKRAHTLLVAGTKGRERPFFWVLSPREHYARPALMR